MERVDLEEVRIKALDQIRNGGNLTGKGGAFAPLIKEFIEAALEAEIESYLDSQERSRGNKRNGKGKKTLKSLSGEVQIDTPQDRHNNFEPVVIKKRERIMSDTLESQILSLYGKGMSFRDISSHIEEIYDMNISHTTLSEITERVIPMVKEWQNRPLDEVYPIVWLDAMHYKVKDEGRVVSRAVYNVLAIDKNGHKNLIGMYVSESEGAKFWLNVLTDLKNRGVNDILIACIDNLKGFAEAIESIFPSVTVQSCIVHQIRNSMKYIPHKYKKEFMADLKPVYKAVNKEQAESRLEELEQKWGEKYPIVIESWNRNWHKLSAFFEFEQSIRTMIYTTNPVEGFHRQVRKITKTKGVFPNDMALKKLIYLATMDIQKKWNRSIENWTTIIQQLRIKYGERMPVDI
ncbi:IS256 family transposase [Halosquirtibacter xylanolyticus]|uniref:IS256 family transposase n=1 Tax=Halosquirtibacter xylanolyticus TaxID=3374599 RepID=UPI0037482318|nr:IS256 family transposase [Prolixibacteraceae bacterium]